MTKNLLFITLLIFLATSCNDLKVLTSYDEDANFTSYKTFGVVNYEAKEGMDKAPNGFVDQYFKEAIEKEMKERGYILSDNRDLEIYYYVKVTTQTEMVASSYPSYGGYYGSPYYYGYYGGYGYGSVGVGVSTTTIQQVDYKAGTLIIDIVDVRADKVVWRGTATKSISGSGSDKRLINEVINRVFYDYKWTVGEVAAAEKKK